MKKSAAGTGNSGILDRPTFIRMLLLANSDLKGRQRNLFIFTLKENKTGLGTR